MSDFKTDCHKAHDLLLADLSGQRVEMPSWVLEVELLEWPPIPVSLTKPAWRVTLGRIMAQRRAERLF